MSTSTSSATALVERTILAIDAPPWDELFRALVGYVVMPAYTGLVAKDTTTWTLLAFFLAVFAALRIVPGILRRVLPFTPETKSVWNVRRGLAKRYDSYQWRKLFGFGAGLLIYLTHTGSIESPATPLAVAFLVAGGVGEFMWMRLARTLSDP